MTDAFIYDAIRTPRGKGRPDGSLHEVTALRLSADTLNALQARTGLPENAVEDVIWGNVTQVGEQGGCLARSAVLASNLGERVPGLSINRFCASGLEAVNLAANQVRAGAGEGYIAGGVEMMSRVPMGSDGAAIAVDPCAGAENLLRPPGHRRRHHRHRNSASPATTSTPTPSRASAAPPPPGPKAASPAPSSPSATSTASPSSTATSTCAPRPTCSRSARSSPPSRTWARPCPASTPWRS